MSTDTIYLRRKSINCVNILVLLLKKRSRSTYFDPRINTWNPRGRDFHNLTFFVLWIKIEFNKEKRHLIGCTFLEKRIRMLPWWSFHNKFLIRDTITFCSNATNFVRSIKFWSLEHDHDGIWHRTVGDLDRIRWRY